MDDWNIPEIPQDQLYVPETIKDKHNFDYIIKTVENNIPLGQDVGEEFHLLSKNSIYEHSRKYKYLHIGCVQVAIKPLIDMGIDAAVLMCLRDIRHNQFEDSLIGTVETNLGQGSIYFNCYPNKTVSMLDRNILDSLFLNIHFHGLDMKEGSIPAALIYRIQYKVMNTCASRVLLKPQKGETTLFITDMTKANVSLPRKIKWDEVTLPERWVMDKATPSIPRPAPTIEHIKQDNSGKVEITFNRRNSFSSRIEASRSEYESSRSIDKETLRKDFYSPENEPQRRWFFQHYKGTNRKQIQDKFYEFVERVKINVLFFDWFHAYAIRKDIDYPWKQDIIGNPTTNVITNWQVKDGELIQSELPPTTQYQLPNIKDSNNKPVMAIPFKTKDVNEEVTSRDIKSLMEQANYTNKYLQALGETIKTKVVPKQKSIEEASPSVPIEKPLFKPFKVSDKAKRKIRELRKTKSLIEGVGDNHSELLNKIGSLLKVIPDTPQASENTSKMVTRSTSKLINVINEDSDQNSDNTTEIGSVSEKNINPINSKHWKTSSKLYYQRPTAPNLLLEERGENNFKSFSANNIYEWNIDAQTEYNIMNTLQHMTMVATAYQTSHECSEETIIDILTDLNGKVITNDDDKEIPNAVNTLIFTISQHFIGDPSLWKDRSAELLSNLKCRTLADFRWYRDTFLTRVYTREDSQQPFWKEKFLAGLPRSLGDKVRDKIRSQSANGDIPYENLSYGQLISYVQKVALKICQDDKIQRQLAKEKAQTKRDLGSFCEQFGLPACPKQKKKQTSRKEAQDHKPTNRRRFSKRRYSQKPSTSREMKNPKQKIKSKITCYNCGKQGHISKYCRLKKKLRNLNLEPAIEEQINNLLIETSEEETETSSSALSNENLNLIQQDDQLSSTDDDGQINTLTREQDLLYDAINSIPDPQEKKVFLEKLKKTLEVKPRQKDFITNNKFDVSNILKRLENSSTKPTTIQDLQTEINNLKREVKELRQQQEIHQIILSQLEENSDSESANNSEENQPENLEDDMFMGLINKIKIQKFYINIKIIIKDFVLETMDLFDTGADSNCILEGLIPTKFFEKTSEKLSTANSSKLKINFKLSNAIIENQGLRINTNFLLVKNLKNEVILGTPFIRALFPIQISNEGITTNYLGRKIIFNFSTKPISRNINLIENKINQINFLKEEVSFNNIQIQLGKPQVKEKIQSLLNHIESTVCSELPHAFWDRKKHIVDLPYEKDFREKQIPTKARPIQMNEELLQYFKEIKAFKIVETDASDIGYSGILKQQVHGQEHVIAYTSKHWNPAQLKYSTVKKEVLAIVLCISKFQSDLLNQKFLVRVDCKSAKDILQKDVKNLASKQIFARWQAILSNISRALPTLYLTTSPVNFYRKFPMPPKVSSSSGRGGRSSTKGKEVLLALPEPITKKATTTSSGSPTQTGSSTQKGKLEGSLTQTTTVKFESSTQESPKPTTTKQTVADYAWSIQTLLALEDIGLTKIPKLAKKTWAEMASESDDDSETDLQKQIQKAKQTKTVCNQKPSQSLTQQESTPQPGNSYISKNKFFNVLQMEPEYWDKNPFKATAKVFPPGFHYRPIATNKTRKFYEFILIDTNSVSIKHFKDPKDPNLNTHSTIQILKDIIIGITLTPGLMCSSIKIHSWLIYLKNNTTYNFPNWFLQWWNYFGPIPQIFPEEVQQGFQQFNRLYNSKESRIPVDLKYFSSFALSWIFSWQYRYGKTENNKQYPPLQRHAFVKWWSQFDTSKAAPDQVKNWFQSNPEFLKPADPETSLFLNQKSQLAAFLASSKSKESLAQNLKEVLQLLQQEVEEEPSKKEAESSETNDDQEDDPFYQNEDDCFGISLDDD
ncbi:polyprotein [Glycine max]|nr:polyprotein [Glycine max]